MADRKVSVRVVAPLPVQVSRYELEEMAFRLDAETVATVFSVNTEPGISNSGQAMVAAMSEASVPEEWAAVLTGVAEGRWPEGFVPGTPNQYLFDFYPTGLQEFCLRERERLSRRVEDAYGLIRWRWARDVAPGAALGVSEFLWSTEGQDWDRIRMRWTFDASLLPQLHLSDKVGGALETLALTGEGEPAGREIWHVAVKMDDRTAIVLAVTAVEVELKRLLGHFVPDALWLLENLQSPPIVRMIEEYLPRVSGISKQARPPEALLHILRKAVTYRNRVVHVGPSSASRWITAAESEVSPLARGDVIDATSDLLWLFDSYRGHSWALELLTPSTRRLLKLPTPDDPGPRTFRIPPVTGA